MNPVPCASEADALATRLSRRCLERQDFRYLRQAREVRMCSHVCVQRTEASAVYYCLRESMHDIILALFNADSGAAYHCSLPVSMPFG